VRNAPRDIECNHRNDYPAERRLVILEWKKTQSDYCEDKRPDEKRSGLYAPTSEKSLLNNAMRITWIERNRLQAMFPHLERGQVELASADESPDKDKDNEDSECDSIRIYHGFQPSTCWSSDYIAR